MNRYKASWLSAGAFAFDLVAVAGTWIAAYLIRFNGAVPHDFQAGALHALFWVLPVYGILFRLFGLYRGMWVFASLPDLVRISKSVGAGALIVMVGAVDGAADARHSAFRADRRAVAALPGDGRRARALSCDEGVLPVRRPRRAGQAGDPARRGQRGREPRA